MKVPNDKPLAAYIMELIAANKLEVFYKTDDWLDLRQEVLDDYHNECVECMKRGQYTEADCVHHVNEVRKRPSLALSKYYTDAKGRRQANLIPLCNKCHNIIHDKLGNYQKKNKFINTERW